jgi:hypothetical protein
VSPSPWHLEHDAAQLQIGPLSAELDLRCPVAGLANWRGLGETAAAVRVLGIETPTFLAGDRDALVEAYLRGPDLVAVYREVSDWPVTVHAQWRAISAESSDPVGSAADALATVELTLSVRTERLESQPELCVASRLPLGELLGVGDVDPSVEAEGPGCVLLRPGQGDWSYAEMVHPADFAGPEAVPPADPAGLLVLRHRLFTRCLEKGVLLRTRVRGVFSARTGDTEIAGESCRSFVGLGPPLGV